MVNVLASDDGSMLEMSSSIDDFSSKSGITVRQQRIKKLFENDVSGDAPR